MAARASAPQSLFSGRAISHRLRRRTDVAFSFAMGAVLALLILRLPMEVALATSVIGAFALLVLVDTRVALLALIFVRSLIDVSASISLIPGSEESGINAAAMMSVVVISVGFAHVTLNRLNLMRIPLAGPFLLIIAITAMGLAIAPDRGAAFEDWLRTLSAFVLFVLVVDLMRDPADAKQLLRVMVLAAVIPVTVGVIEFFSGEGFEAEGIIRADGTFVHPSPFAFFLVGTLPLMLAFLLNSTSRLVQVGLVILIPATLICIYASQTRGAWVGLVVMLTVFVAVRARWLALLVPLAAIGFALVLPGVRDRFSEATSETGSVVWRQQQWSDAMAMASPVQLATTGAGLRAIDTNLGELAHNEYIRLLVETGIIGLVATIVLYKRVLSIAVNAYRTTGDRFTRDVMLVFCMALVARVVIALTDNILIFPALEWYFWGFAGVVVVLSGTYRRHIVGESAPRYEENPTSA